MDLRRFGPGLLRADLDQLEAQASSSSLNEGVRDYCRDEGIVLTRCRPYCKNEQAYIEQKNGSVVRQIVGYRRFEGMTAAHELAQLCARTRLFVNAFRPSFKLMDREREGAPVRKRYYAPATLCDRLVADPRTSSEVHGRVEALRTDLDPVRLLAEIRAAQARFDPPLISRTRGD
ncbi:hypothetical protein ABIE45_006216 [Methylobacterium sp. OAE515]|uniref:hypothetical protein n=1 Tax=Methylobacterium sp. OAE515 TaxID=2817895 RepID=UPI00178AD1EE